MHKTYAIPQYVLDEIEQHAKDVERYLSGQLSSDLFKARRVPRGIYEQRQHGLYMVRVRVAGGFLWSSQAKKLAELSRRYANGRVHVTTRQDIQLHEVKIEDTYPIMKGLLEVGLTPLGGGGNTVRNITACSHGGLLPGEVFDPQPYAVALTNYLLPFQSSYNLPRKFKIAFSGCATDCSLAQVNDLGFLAKIRNGQKGFAVYVGGGMGTRSRVAELFKDFIPVEDLLRVAEAVKRVFLRYGDRRNPHRARLRFVVERLGVDNFLHELEQELLKVTAEGIPNAVPVELAAEPLPPAAPPADVHIDGDAFEKWRKIAVRPQRQEGFFLATVLIQRGDLAADDLQRLAEAAERHAGSQLRTDRLQNLLIPYIPAAHLASLYHELQNLSQNVTVPHHGESLLVSCKGAATCRLGICRSQDLNAAISQEALKAGLDRSVFSEIEIHTSGCPNNCGQHAIAPLGFFGAARRKNGRSYPCYTIVAGGQAGKDGATLSQNLAELPAKHIPAFTVELLKDYANSQLRPQGFLAYWEQRGRALALELTGKYSVIPAPEEAPDFYRDFGTEEDFSLAGRGPGECGAGIFELIAQELKKAEAEFLDAKQLVKETSERAQKLLHAVVLAAGALLVTRGIEPGNPDVALKEFERHFIDQGLADKKHLELLLLARSALRGKAQLLLDEEARIRALLDEVQALYDSMDAALNFPVKLKDQAEQKTCTFNKPPELNLRGVKCPMNFVRAKIALEQLEEGQVLEVILDEGEPINNVPASFRSQGQEVISITPEDADSYRVKIRRVK